MADAPQPLDRRTYRTVWTNLFRRIPGPIAAVWGICAVIQFAIITHMAGQPIDSFLVFIGGSFSLWLLHALQKGLYAPMRDIAESSASAMTLGATLGIALRRLGPVLLIQLIIGFIFAAVVITFLFAGAPPFATFVVLQMFWFLLAPAVYFVVTHRDSVFSALQKGLSAARHNLLWIVGVPALFWCLGAAIDEYIGSLHLLVEAMAAGELPALLQGLFMYVLYRYLRWISVASVYVGVDVKND